MPRITIEFEPASGDWGAQICWLNAVLAGALLGMIINRVPVFRRGPAVFTFGSPLVPGELPASRYSCKTFDTDQQRQRFLAALEEAFRTAHPEALSGGGAAMTGLPPAEARRAQTWNLAIASVLIGTAVAFEDIEHDRRWSGLGGFCVSKEDGAWYCHAAGEGGYSTVAMVHSTVP
jgi:hypothetical protein